MLKKDRRPGMAGKVLPKASANSEKRGVRYIIVLELSKKRGKGVSINRRDAQSFTRKKSAWRPPPTKHQEKKVLS